VGVGMWGKGHALDDGEGTCIRGGRHVGEGKYIEGFRCSMRKELPQGRRCFVFEAECLVAEDSLANLPWRRPHLLQNCVHLAHVRVGPAPCERGGGVRKGATCVSDCTCVGVGVGVGVVLPSLAKFLSPICQPHVSLSFSLPPPPCRTCAPK
jgi:hypothetical protein